MQKIFVKDIGLFAPQIDYMKLHIYNWPNKGKVNNLRAKDLIIKAGKATYIKDFEV
jgi:hypothetical protein